MRVMLITHRALEDRPNASEADLAEAAAAFRKLSMAQDPAADLLARCLGPAFIALKQYGKAEEVLRELLDGRRRTLGEHHRGTHDARVALAQLYQRAGEPAKAEPLLVESLTEMRMSFGEDDPSTESARCQLCALYMNDLKRYRDAEPLLRHTLERNRKQLGPLHRATLVTQTDLGGVYATLNRTA